MVDAQKLVVEEDFRVPPYELLGLLAVGIKGVECQGYNLDSPWTVHHHFIPCSPGANWGVSALCIPKRVFFLLWTLHSFTVGKAWINSSLVDVCLYWSRYPSFGTFLSLSLSSFCSADKCISKIAVQENNEEELNVHWRVWRALILSLEAENEEVGD